MNRYGWRTAVLEVLMILIAILFLSPMLILVNIAFKSGSDTSNAFSLPTSPTLQNFIDAWTEGNLANALINTTVVVVVSLAILVPTASLAGYVLARSTARLSRLANGLFLIGLLLPLQLATIPLYQIIRSLGLLGTVWSLVLFYVSQLMPFSVFLYANFLRALPTDYEEAAQVDGARPVRAFFSVVFPMMRAVTGTVIILNTISIWNDFFTPQLYLAGSGTQTVTVSLYSYVGQYSTQWPLIFGGLIIASLPLLVLFFILQRNVIQGFAGGLKG